MEFAGYLARNHGKVLYVAKEEKLNSTLQTKLKETNVVHPNLIVSDHLPTDLSPYNFIFLDSVNTLGLKPKDLTELKTKNPDKSFVFVFQTTKLGDFRGANEFQHFVDVVIELPEQGKAIQFGRFNQGGEMNIFPQENGLPSESIPSLEGVKKDSAKKKKYPAWVAPSFLTEEDRVELKQLYELYAEGKMKEAMVIGSRVNSIVRDQIPGDIWVAMGGEVSPEKAKEIEKEKAVQQEAILRSYENEPDASNPIFLFSLSATKVLTDALKGGYDVMYLIRRELANRGVDENGIWVGFDKAAKIHGIMK